MLDRPEAAEAAERYISQARPLFSRLPFDYRMVPLSLRTRVLRILNRSAGDDVRSDLEYATTSPGAGVLAYAGRRAVLIITHDVDSRNELELIERIREHERAVDVVSAWGFVPRVSWPSETVARELVREGCEVYWHDISHNGRLPFLSPTAIRSAFDEVASKSPWALELMRAFRSGQLLASPDLIDAVAERFEIDMSIPDVERGGPYGDAAGCRTVHPFLLRGILEIPLTLPQDVFLRHVYGMSAEATLSTWQHKLNWIKRIGGVAVMNVHPIWIGDRHRDTLQAYMRFVTDAAADDELLVTTPTRLRDLLMPERLPGSNL
jgi:hypothetical protein